MLTKSAMDAAGGAAGLVVAEGLGLFREALVALLSEARAGGPRVRSAGTLEEALVQVERSMTAGGSAGLLLLDLALLGDAGASALSTVRERFPTVRIVAFAGAGSRDEALRCLAAGAHGYVAKSATAAELIRAIGVVEDGGVHVPVSLAMAPITEGEAGTGTKAVPEARSGEAAPARFVSVHGAGITRMLTGRQRDVLRLMAEGRSTKDIARTLDLAVSTIKVHLAGVYRTVGARNRVEALCRAGLLPAEALMS